MSVLFPEDLRVLGEPVVAWVHRWCGCFVASHRKVCGGRFRGSMANSCVGLVPSVSGAAQWSVATHQAAASLSWMVVAVRRKPRCDEPDEVGPFGRSLPPT